ncbi:MAG TPA: enolase C-terminal domain-like protein, partial [Methylomirabilota bacterium]|nr:enolase C-terminal domain-like protein [Methylomirabilota bacterium]
IMPAGAAVDEAHKLLAEGFRAAKIRVGRPDAREDLAVVRAVRKAAGDELLPFEIERKLAQRFTLLGLAGLQRLAQSGIDMAAWDALAQAHRLPLVVLLGGAVKPIPTYNSKGLWIQPVETLADEADALLAEGFTAVKLRLGREDFAQDLAAVRAVKTRVGDRVTVMCDFNQRLTVNEAIRRARALDGEGLYWIEEPVRHDDYEGYARIAAEAATPIQTGENLVDTFEMARAIALRSLDFVMPDVQRIGGVTGWLRAAALAHAHGIEMSSHLFPEFSLHLLGVTPTCHWLEFMDWAAPLLREPVRVKDGVARIPDRPGAGLEWDEAAVARYSA